MENKEIIGKFLPYGSANKNETRCEHEESELYERHVSKFFFICKSICGFMVARAIARRICNKFEMMFHSPSQLNGVNYDDFYIFVMFIEGKVPKIPPSHSLALDFLKVSKVALTEGFPVFNNTILSAKIFFKGVINSSAQEGVRNITPSK